jgi:hypothetical protein
MPTLWDAPVRQAMRDRVGRLTPASTPQWGKMNVAGMLAHINDSYRMATGELTCAPRWLPFRYPPLRQLIVYVMPIPKGAPTAPELIARSSTAQFEAERAAFMVWMDRLGTVTSGSLVPHPAFGHLSHKEYGVLMAKHADHHLRQFGV